MTIHKNTKQHDITLPFLIVLFVIVVAVFGGVLNNANYSTNSKAQDTFTCDPKSQGPCYTECGKCSDSGTQCTADLNSRCGPGFQVYETTGKCYCTKNPPGGSSTSPTPTIPPTSTVLAPNVSGIPLGFGGENQPCNINKNKIYFCQSGLFLRGATAEDCSCIKPNIEMSSIVRFNNCDQGLSEGTCNFSSYASIEDSHLNTEISGMEPYAFDDKGKWISYYTHILYVISRQDKKIITISTQVDKSTLFSENFVSILYFQPYVNIDELLCNNKYTSEWDCRESIITGNEILLTSVNFDKFGWQEGRDYFLAPVTSTFGKYKNKLLGEKCSAFEPCQSGLICGHGNQGVCKNKQDYSTQYQISLYISQTARPDGIIYQEPRGYNDRIMAVKGKNDYHIEQPYEILTPNEGDSAITYFFSLYNGTKDWSGTLNGLYLLFYSCDGKGFNRISIANLNPSHIYKKCTWSSGANSIKILGFDFSATPDKFDQALKTFNMTTNYSESHITKVLGDIKYPHKNELATPDIQNSVTFDQVNFVGIDPAPTPTAYFQQIH